MQNNRSTEQVAETAETAQVTESKPKTLKEALAALDGVRFNDASTMLKQGNLKGQGKGDYTR